MDKQTLIEQVFLYILKKRGGEFDSYSMIRMLTRRFNAYNFSEIIDNIVNSGLAERIKRDSYEGYKITESGIKLLGNNHEDLKNSTLSFFPDQEEFITILFN